MIDRTGKLHPEMPCHRPSQSHTPPLHVNSYLKG
jgi:hypothetical protein